MAAAAVAGSTSHQQDQEGTSVDGAVVEGIVSFSEDEDANDSVKDAFDSDATNDADYKPTSTVSFWIDYLFVSLKMWEHGRGGVKGHNNGRF